MVNAMKVAVNGPEMEPARFDNTGEKPATISQ